MIDPLFASDICGTLKVISPLILFFIALILPNKSRRLTSVEKVFGKIAKRKQLSLLLVAVLTFIGAAMVSLLVAWPIPVFHDEFSYLLAADTFAHGRLTNPFHPMWIHFETFFVLSQPTYMSFYQPGQGLMLALGQVLGYPIVGAWISMALACAATCWMLQGWLPPRWALLGALLMILKLGLFSYWSQSFWGGAVAATGGAVVYGAMRRIIKKPNTANALLFGLGLGILLNSRPYEGLLVSLPAITYLLFWMKGKYSPPFSILFREIILPLLLVILLVGVFTGYYNWRITGKPWVLPYQLYQTLYATTSNFLWVKPRLGIKYNHEEFRKIYYGLYITLYNENIGLSNFIDVSLLKLQNLSNFFLGFSFSLTLVALPLLRKNFWVRFSIIVLVLLLIGMLLVVFSFPHYAAPGVCLIYFLVLQCMRSIYFFHWRKRYLGRPIVWSIVFYYILIIILPISLKLDPFVYVNPAHWELPRTVFPTWSVDRENMIAKLNQEEGLHLVIVKYWPDHAGEAEWVYNEADIDNAKIIWARDMSLEENCGLFQYFNKQKRKIWLLEKKNSPNLILAPYPLDLCH